MIFNIKKYINSQFDPTLEEREYLKDVERYGKETADANVERLEESSREKVTGEKKMTLAEILNINYFWDFDKESNTELIFEPE